MSKIHFVGGEKGGVGKSFTARVLAQYHVDNKRPFTGFDTDQSHTTFSRFYEEFTQPVDTKGEALDIILEHLYLYPDNDIIVDLAAQTASNLYTWMEECDFFTLLRENCSQAYFWHVLDDSADCKNLLSKTVSQLQDKPCKLTVVKNLGCGENFSPLEKSEVYSQAIENGATIMELPALPSLVNQKIDFDNLSFWAAANNPHWLNRVERQRVLIWLKKIYQSLDTILEDTKKQQTAIADNQELYQ